MIHLDRDPTDYDDTTPSEWPLYELSPASATLWVVGGILLVLVGGLGFLLAWLIWGSL